MLDEFNTLLNQYKENNQTSKEEYNSLVNELLKEMDNTWKI